MTTTMPCRRTDGKLHDGLNQYSPDRYMRPGLDGSEPDEDYVMAPFSETEDVDLLYALQDGATVAEIALDLGRRQADIDHRLRQLLARPALRALFRAAAVPAGGAL